MAESFPEPALQPPSRTSVDEPAAVAHAPGLTHDQLRAGGNAEEAARNVDQPATSATVLVTQHLETYSSGSISFEEGAPFFTIALLAA